MRQANVRAMPCADCGVWMPHGARWGYCGKCRKRHICPLCNMPTARKGVSEWCVECKKVGHALEILRKLFPSVRPPADELAARVEIYTRRAGLGRDLFDPSPTFLDLPHAGRDVSERPAPRLCQSNGKGAHPLNGSCTRCRRERRSCKGA